MTKGTTPKSEVGVVFTGPFQNNQRNRIIFRAMANTLAGNLQRTLREDMGGTYGVSVVPEFTKLPTEEYRLTITFACDPARTQDLVKAMFAVVDSSGRRAPAQARSRTRRRGCGATSRPTAGRTVTSSVSWRSRISTDEPIPDPATLRDSTIS